MSAQSLTSNMSQSPPSKIERLPPELQLMMLSNLPAKDICRARRISHHFQALIDHPTNQTMLFQPGQSRSLSRIQTTVNAVLNYDPAEGFWEIFRKFIAHRGLTWLRSERRAEMTIFLNQWEYRRSGKKRPYDDANGPAFAHTCLRLELCNIIQEHIEWHVPEFRGIQGAYFVRLHQECLDAILEYLQTTQEAMQDLYTRIRETPGAYLRGRPQWILLPERRPQWCLTELDIPWDMILTGRRIRLPFFCATPKQVADLLDVPDVSRHCAGFAYCVKTRAMFDVVAKAVAEGKALSQGEKARVLEQTFLF